MNILQNLYNKFFQDKKYELPETTTTNSESKQATTIKPSNKNIREQLAAKQKETEKYAEDLKISYEEASKTLGANPIMTQCINFYNSNFDSNERAIGITFIGQKVFPRAVPLVKQAMSDIVTKQGIQLKELTQEENLEQLLYFQLENRTNITRSYKRFGF